MGLIKLAQSKIRKFIDMATSHEDLFARLGKGMRNDVNPLFKGAPRTGEYHGLLTSLKDKTLSLPEAKKQAKIFLGDAYGNKFYSKRSEGFSLQDRVKYHYAGKQGVLGNRLPQASLIRETPLGGEEYHDIWHSHGLDPIKARLEGNSPQHLETHNRMANGLLENWGMQVHTSFPGEGAGSRANYYAQRGANAHVSEPATLTGRIKGKYLFRNNDSSGGGSEAGIPRQFMQHIENPKITVHQNDRHQF